MTSLSTRCGAAWGPIALQLGSQRLFIWSALDGYGELGGQMLRLGVQDVELKCM